MRKTSGMVILGLLFILSACNTMKGMGTDVQKGGEAITDQAEETQKTM